MTDDRLIQVPTATVEAHARRQQQLRRARASYRLRHPELTTRNKLRQQSKPFIAWDGEGPRDAGYALFGSSDGDEIRKPFLSTMECLDLILDCKLRNPDSIHVWYGSNYDVSMILHDMPWKQYSALKHWNRCVWHDYEIEHIPGKWFVVKRHGVIAKIFDVCSFFEGPYVQALEDMAIGTAQEIEILKREKARRSEFLFSEINEIRDYWQLELRLMPQLCDKLRSAFLDAGFDVRSWHGPGALANMAMRKHGVFQCMAESPRQVKWAAKCAFAGGRFEMFRGGYIQHRIYNADIHSAYPHFARQLPNLAKGRWRQGHKYEAGKFAVYHIRYKEHRMPVQFELEKAEKRVRSLKPYPLFHRLKGGNVVWDNNVEGWYWGPEAELVANNPDAIFIESWVFDEDNANDRPFAWLADYYDQRQAYKDEGSVLELTFKLIINAIYGQLAQRAGWDKRKRTSPKSHQLEWAGWITSACRAAVYRAAIDVGDRLISIDTDGVYAHGPFSDLDIGRNLGQWDVAEYDSGVFWQSGIYALSSVVCVDKECANRGGDSRACGHEWVKGKTRGIPKGKYEAADLIHALEHGEDLHLKRKVFTGYGLALNGQRSRLNTWSEDDVTIVFGGDGKRYHNKVRCAGRICPGDGVHHFMPAMIRDNPYDNIVSEPHTLPWEVTDLLAESHKRKVDDMTFFNQNHLDYDEQWVKDYEEVII